MSDKITINKRGEVCRVSSYGYKYYLWRCITCLNTPPDLALFNNREGNVWDRICIFCDTEQVQCFGADCESCINRFRCYTT